MRTPLTQKRPHPLLVNQKRRQRLFFILFIIFTLLMGILVATVEAMPTTTFDTMVSLQIQGIRLIGFDALMQLLSSEIWVFGLIGAGLLFVVFKIGWQQATYVISLGLLQRLINQFLKIVIDRPRPLDNFVNVIASSSSSSFPSGHVMLYTVFLGFLGFLILFHIKPSMLRTLTLLLAVFLVFLIGLSRIYMGAHWFTDVMAAYFLGIMVLIAGIEGYLKYVTPRHKI
jgi:membrane-associated phospholipid phosphatase